jgi:proteasome lid subunit RPN8/RPN11
VIRIPRTLLRRIAAAAERAYPEEGCGLLVGRVVRAGEGRERMIQVSAAADSLNIAPPPRRSTFEIDPALRLRLLRTLRGTADAVVGHWHSHPDAPAIPSARDAAMVYEPDLLWLIVAVADGVAGETAAWRYDPAAAQFRPMSLAMID